jgi:CHASE3 domain sensor protein
MLLLKIQDSVVVSTLPHPISMFFIGVTFVISIYLYFELMKYRQEVRAISKENSEIRDNIRTAKNEIDKIVSELSKKVDSRVDKAIESIKKISQK